MVDSWGRGLEKCNHSNSLRALDTRTDHWWLGGRFVIVWTADCHFNVNWEECVAVEISLKHTFSHQHILTAHSHRKKGRHRRKQWKQGRYGLPCMDWVTGLQFWTLLISILIPFEATPPLPFHEISSQESGESEYYEFMHELAKLTQRLILTLFLLIVLRNVVDNESLV